MMTTIQQLKKIEDVIYSIEYDRLSNYLKGIRDMINLLNGEEQEQSFLANFIVKEIKDFYKMEKGE